MVAKIFRIIIKIITGIFLLALLLLFPYTITPVYEYPDSKPFRGDKLYNPYEDTDFQHWQRINFHAHSDRWGSPGITNALANSPEQIHDIYVNELGYTMAGISDYQHINRSLDTMSSFIPVYEHGYNINRVHQLPVNAKRVSYLDYPLTQKTNHKQHVINTLRRQSDFVAIAHPHLDSGYKAPEIKDLSNYQAIEILNTLAFYRNAVDLWDVALSSGKYIVAVGDDDTHNLDKRREFGYRFNAVGTNSKDGDVLLEEVKKGNHFVVSIHRSSKDNLERKKQKLKDVERRISGFTVSGDTLSLAVTDSVFYLAFYGDNGKELMKIDGTLEAQYIMQPEDSYVRAEAHFKDHTNIYLNPVVRYSGDITEYQPHATVKYFTTIIYTIFRIAIWLMLFSFVLVKVIIRWR